MENLNLKAINKQGGALTLAVSLTILMLSTLVTFNVSKAILMEQKNFEQRYSRQNGF